MSSNDNIIEPFSDEHPMVAVDSSLNPKKSKFKCCGRENYESVFYYCKICDKYLHKSCAELPKRLEDHHFHPHHLFTLHSGDRMKGEKFMCNACGIEIKGFIYKCSSSSSECEFRLHPDCAKLKIYKNTSDEEYHLGHPHPLFLCDKDDINPSEDYYCFMCPFKLEDAGASTFYVCLECKGFLHVSCADFPDKLNHPFHPQHPLFLRRQDWDIHDWVNRKSWFAYYKKREMFHYSCMECEFFLDPLCSNLKPVQSSSAQVLRCPIKPMHLPLMIMCDTPPNFPLRCSGCNEVHKVLVDDSIIYVCLECRILLCKSCAQLPSKIVHPLHPQHPLILSKHIQVDTYKTKCLACFHQIGVRFKYRCYQCNFNLHAATCASIDNFPMIKSQGHPHPLAFYEYNRTIRTDKLNCHSCNYPFDSHFFGCGLCNFMIHPCCLPDELPPTIKNEHHLHPLTFTNSPIRDYEYEDENSELYCDACEERRQLYHPTYYCAECRFKAHVHCAISQVLSYLKAKVTPIKILGNTDAFTGKQASSYAGANSWVQMLSLAGTVGVSLYIILLLLFGIGAPLHRAYTST